MKCAECGILLPDGGHAYETKAGIYYKCKRCFKTDPVLRNYQPCEIYTRCVGYLRPFSQMNPGKQAEISQRKMLKVQHSGNSG